MPVNSTKSQWEVKIKGVEGYHPVKNIKDLGPEKGNNYELHDGRSIHQSRLEDMRPIMKPTNAPARLEKADAGQYQVHLGVPPSKESTGKYAQWHLNKEQLGHVLKNWDKVQWEHRSGSRPSSEGKFHSTAITRNKLSTPIAGYLDRHEPQGRVLYHGCGRDDVGAKALGAERHDPYHPDPAVQAMPKGKFNEIHSHYTLNVVDKDVGHKILSHIHGLMADDGKAVISVRRDLKGGPK